MTHRFLIAVPAAVEGARLIADGGFTCIPEGAELTVQRAEAGDLYVPCSCENGRHLLDSTMSDNAWHYVGFRPAE